MLQKTVYKLDNANLHSASPTYFTFNFGATKEPKDGNIELVSGTHSCREGLFINMRRRICGKDVHQPTDKMRMMFVWKLNSNNQKFDNDLIDGWIKRAVPIVQAVDRMAGWPLTRAYTVNTENKYVRACYFHSSRRWMKASYLVSLYVLLVRMAKDKRIADFKDFEGLYGVLNKVINSGTPLIIDHAYVKDSLPYWEAVMKGYPRLFRQHKMPYYWDTNRLDRSSGGSEGIQYLVEGNTAYGKIRSEMLKIKKELDSKKS